MPARPRPTQARKNLYCVARPSQITLRNRPAFGASFEFGRAATTPGRHVEDVMTNFKFGLAGAASLALAFTIASASAQEITRVRGTIDKVDGNTLLVKSR